jgi:hypothetical protein
MGLREEFVECYCVLQNGGVFAWGNSVRGNEGEVKGFVGGGGISEQFATLGQPCGIVVSDFVPGGRVFHLAEVDDVVASVDEKVDLSGTIVP